MGKLNAKLVEHAKPKVTEYRVADGDGLFLRVRASGAKSWLFCFRLGNDRKWRQMPLGKISDVSLKEAREEVSLLRKLVAQGIDPQIEKAAAKDKNIQAITMQTLFEKWMEFLKPTEINSADSSEIIVEKKSKLRAIDRYQNRWRLHLKKPLGNLLAKDITRGHLAVALDEMKQKGIKEETRKALTTLNLMLDFGLSRQFIEQNHARLLKPKDFEATASKPRDRTLSLTELRHLWRALDDANVTDDETDDISKISIVTICAIKLLIGSSGIPVVCAYLAQSHCA